MVILCGVRFGNNLGRLASIPTGLSSLAAVRWAAVVRFLAALALPAFRFVWLRLALIWVRELLPCCYALRCGRTTDHPSRNHNVSVAIFKTWRQTILPSPPHTHPSLILWYQNVSFWGGRIHSKDGHSSRPPEAVPSSGRAGAPAVVQAFPRFCVRRDGGCSGGGEVKRLFSCSLLNCCSFSCLRFYLVLPYPILCFAWYAVSSFFLPFLISSYTVLPSIV